MLGATVEERGFDTSTTADGVFRLLEAAREVLPDVGELEWTGVRAGLRPGTPDNLPVVGPGSWTASCGRRATTGTACCSLPSPARRSRASCAGRRVAPSDEAAMRIVLNGEPRELRAAPRSSTRSTRAARPESRDGVAVAVDGEVVPRSSWADRTLAEGEQVEVLQAVQGG